MIPWFLNCSLVVQEGSSTQGGVLQEASACQLCLQTSVISIVLHPPWRAKSLSPKFTGAESVFLPNVDQLQPELKKKNQWTVTVGNIQNLGVFYAWSKSWELICPASVGAHHLSFLPIFSSMSFIISSVVGSMHVSGKRMGRETPKKIMTLVPDNNTEWDSLFMKQIHKKYLRGYLNLAVWCFYLHVHKVILFNKKVLS